MGRRDGQASGVLTGKWHFTREAGNGWRGDEGDHVPSIRSAEAHRKSTFSRGVGQPIPIYKPRNDLVSSLFFQTRTQNDLEGGYARGGLK